MKTSAPLKKSQFGLYVECAQHPGEAYYNIPYLYTFDGSLDEDRLKTAIETAVAAHPTLLTRIGVDEHGDPIQTVDDSETITLGEVERVTDIRAAIEGFIQPFDIYNDHFFRMRMLRDDENYYWLLDIHHIIGDGSTLKVLLDDIGAAYEGKELTPETITMAELAREEDEQRKTPQFEADKQWYAREYDCGDCYSTLLPDLDGTEDADALEARCMNIESTRVDAFCREHGIFKSTLFTAAYSFLLAKYNNEQAALFSTIVSGRNDRRTAHTVGMLVKTVPVYAHFTDETTVLDFLKAGQEQMTGCREHGLYAYTDAVNDLKLQIGTYFAWHGFVLDNVEVGGKHVQSEQLCNTTLGVPFFVKALIQDGHYLVKAEYKAHLYSQQLVSQFLASYENVVEGLLTETKLSDIQITNTSQLVLLDSFNDTDRPYDDTQTVVSLFRRQAKATPDAEAVVFKDHRYTYAEVDDISDRIAAYIASKELGVGDAVSVIIPRCEWMAIASLGVLKAGCAYQPLDPSYPKERLNFMVKDAAARLLIADASLRDLVDEYAGEVLLTKDIESLPPLTAEANCQLSTVNSQLSPSDRFILLYTSGSTGVPKGCQLTHGNLVCYCNWYWKYYDLKPEHNVAEYASYGFDVHQEGIYPPLTGGATVHIIPEELRLDLVSLNEYLEREHITHTFMTTQVGYQFATNIENHSLLHLSVAGEKLASIAPPQGYQLHNGYGPTEATILITIYPITKKDTDVPIGKPMDNVRLYVVDQHGHRLPVGALGELWAAGPQVALGYLNRPDKNAEVFIQNPFTTEEKYIRAYRTGDIVRYLPSGDIQFIGRRDGQVKIRGFRVELKEVEAVIRQFPGIKDATVQAFDDPNGGKFIAAYIVGDEQIDINALNNFILEEKPPYMVPAVTMQIDAIPLNQNQKVNKRALPIPEKKAADVEESNVPMNVLEQELHEIIAGIVGNTDFGITTVLGHAGLTSISAIKLAIQVNKHYGITLDAKSLAKTATLQSIENEILKETFYRGEKSEVSGERIVGGAEQSQDIDLTSHLSPLTSVPLSYAQTGVYVDCMKQPTSTVYNIPSCIRLPQGTDVQLLSKSIETVIKSHPQFFVHFDSEDGDIVQTVDLTQPVEVKQRTLSTAELEQFKKEFVKPFNLSQGPLYRMEIVCCGQNVFLFTDVHHLIFDGGSFDLFLNQLCDLMNGIEIEAEIIRYADFVADEKAAEGSESYLEAKTFFQKRLGDIEGVTEVPADLTNPLESGSPSEVFCPLNFSAIEVFCKQHNLSPAHFTLAAVFYTLSRFTNNEQVCITTISNGRSDLRIRNTVGMFVNTLAMSAKIGEQTVMDFLTETGTNFDKTLTHEKYPFAQIAADYGLSAEILFAYQMGVFDQYRINGQELDVETLRLDATKFRIAFYIQEQDGVPGVLIEYDNGRYSQELMQSLGQSIGNAVNAFIRQPEAVLKGISLLDKNQTALLDSFNDTEVPYDTTQTVVSLFRRQVQLTSDNIAVVYHEQRYTYREVDDITERIAAYLVRRGLGREDVVSIIIPRSEWMPIAALGVLKAGCAYQPLDPSYPAERLNFMVKDADAKLLIADEALRDIVDEYNGEVLLTKDILSLPAAESQAVVPRPEDLFILLYTSGSTGLPKGCQLEHGNLAAFCHWYQRRFELKAEHHVSCYASYGFDCCMMDMYPALTCGACVYIIGDDIRLTLPEVNAYFEANHITHSFMTTQVAYQFATSYDNHSLLHLIAAGEKLASLTPPKNFRLHNGYGPTEGTILITEYEVEKLEKDIPVGKPLDNSRLYVVDKQFNRLPPGALGELWISGPHVTRSYLNRPEKTAEVYIGNPFCDEKKFARIYRTGDIVRYLPDGNIQFAGRRDGQVKIRGFRIELKEIEAVIRQYSAIKDVTVQAFDHPNGGKFIAAYIVSDTTVDIKELNAFIGKQKPPYMVPAVTMQIDAIPLNQNQKVNKKALPEPAMQVVAHDYVAPEGETETLFTQIFSQVLNIEQVGATDDFFEIGGTSINAIKVIVEASKHGVQIVFNDLFNLKTPKALAEYVSGNTATPGAAAPTVPTNQPSTMDHPEYAAFIPVLDKNILTTFRDGERQPVGDVLLTGATGYLGIHILHELLTNYDGHILCPLRCEPGSNPMHRLKTLHYYYFGESEAFGHFDERVEAFAAKITEPDALKGIDKRDLTVINCVANVKHFSAGNDIEMVNIESVRHLISFCLRTGSRLIHISTNSIAGISIDNVPGPEVRLTEQNLYIGQNIDANKYVYSKFKAEELVLDAIAHHGLNAKIMRVGNLSARQKDGEFQINFNTNNFLAMLRAYVIIGMVPYEALDLRFEFSPIDEVAHAIMLLAQTPKGCTVFHPYNTHRQFMSDILTGFAEAGITLKRVEPEEFQRTLESVMENPDLVTLLRPLMAYDMGTGHKTRWIESTNDYTTQVLYRLGFQWPPTAAAYVHRFVDTIMGFDYFTIPGTGKSM